MTIKLCRLLQKYGMRGIIQMVVTAWDEKYYQVAIILPDEDIRMKFHLKHAYKELIAAEKVRK